MRTNVIAAISTPPGKGGVAIIRMSGEGAHRIACQVFRPLSGRDVLSYPMRTQIYGHIIYNGETVDDGMLTLFPSGGSYTGEDIAEISCHGGTLVTALVLEAVFASGAIPAEAGEFTARAFVNGRLSLTEAESIGTLLEAQSREQLRLSAAPARTALKNSIDEIRGAITNICSSIYARIDYPEEDLGEYTDAEIVSALKGVRERIAKLTDTYSTARAINEGISTVICGKPNVGKSTLYNLLLGEDAAIVTDIAGTTRDILERTVPLGKVLLRVCDTAGVRDASDEVERIGIVRTKERISSAELILALFDSSAPLDEQDEELLRIIRASEGTKICIINKTDRVPANAGALPTELFDLTLTVSAKYDGEKARDELCRAVSRLFTDEKISPCRDAIVTTARQHGALSLAKGFIDTAIDALAIGVPVDAASADIERALGAIAEVDGRGVSEAIVTDIFSRFCVGK